MIFNDHFQNYKRYQIPKAQFIIADIPYNVGKNAYGSNPKWYIDGDNKKGQSELAGKEFFDTDKNFNPPEFMHFCSKMLKKEPKQKAQSPAMLVFCSFEQQFLMIELAKKYGLNNYINLVFRKNFSAQVLKANMRIVGNAEYGLILYRDKLPKFNNNKKMVFNIIDWEKDHVDDLLIRKIHPCLPAGEKVFFNKKWKNIENVKIGDINRYGKVISTSFHMAEKLIEIKINKYKTIATYNHPFLIKRLNKIYWINAENIKKNDFILTKVFVYSILKPLNYKTGESICKKNIEKQKRDISGSKKMRLESLGLNIVLFGKNILAKFLWECKYIIKILTGETTKFPISKLSHNLNINGYTLVVDLSKVNGKNHVKYAGNTRNAIKKIGIILAGGLMGGYVKNVISKNQLKQERFLLQKVGSVKIINQKTKVYNLTMDNIPAFDTLIGVSHNTQKPVKLLERLIKIFTDENDVVIDPVAGSGSTLIACINTNRKGYGFEIKKEFFKQASKWENDIITNIDDIKKHGFTKSLIDKTNTDQFKLELK